MTRNNLMTEDKDYDRDNKKKVWFELSQKACYYNYSFL